MKFSEKVRACRKAKGLTQQELAAQLGMSKRTVEGYEAGKCYPRSREVYARLAGIFGVDVNFLTSEDESANPDAREQARRLVENARALYAGGELNDVDKDELAKALMDAYFIARAKRAE